MAGAVRTGENRLRESTALPAQLSKVDRFGRVDHVRRCFCQLQDEVRIGVAVWRTAYPAIYQ